MDKYTDMFFMSGPGEYLKQAPKRIVVEGMLNTEIIKGKTYCIVLV